MITRAERIAAARRYAPPLVEVVRADRRGARLRQVSRRAIEYARNAGLTLGEVYPAARSQLGGLAPSVFGADPQPASQPWGWRAAALGLVLGALVGPVTALVGLGVGAAMAVRS
jgi:hypothetical protein